MSKQRKEGSTEAGEEKGTEKIEIKGEDRMAEVSELGKKEKCSLR